MFIARLAKALQKAGVKYAIAGGYAVALHGAVRGSVDVDVVIATTLKSFEKFEAVMKSLGLESRIPVTGKDVFNFRKEYIEKRNLIAWSFCNSNNSTELVDLIITHDLNQMKYSAKLFGKTSVQVISKEDLILMKKQSGRPQDLEDIKALENL